MLAALMGRTGGLQDALDCGRQGFRHINAFSRDDDPFEPDMLAQTCEASAKVAAGFGIPGGPARRQRQPLGVLLHVEGDQAYRPNSSGVVRKIAGSDH